ncbi:hypothetical protein AB5J52_32520 [Streptomyces sp. R39]|uniref:Uncharacterized protein n=1 Tax=Streptomyces sp. R39 TaxID=3238631 RepID=A0AB39QVU5_9ACTN
MTDVDPPSTASRTLRASVGLTALAATLLVCGAAVEATGNLLDSSAQRSGSSHPATTAHPAPTRSRASETPPPHRPPTASPTCPPRPTVIATATATVIATPTLTLTPTPTPTPTATASPLNGW